jgi:hypothetical protein
LLDRLLDPLAYPSVVTSPNQILISHLRSDNKSESPTLRKESPLTPNAYDIDGFFNQLRNQRRYDKGTQNRYNNSPEDTARTREDIDPIVPSNQYRIALENIRKLHPEVTELVDHITTVEGILYHRL